jgi:hypothetical protein
MKSSLGKVRAGNDIFFAPFTLLKNFGCGVFGRRARI